VESDTGWLRDLDGVRVVELDGPRAVFEVDRDEGEQEVLAAALRRGAVRGFSPVIPTLDEIFKEVV
jgi:ABC-2 type transport system ATP-binding protein